MTVKVATLVRLLPSAIVASEITILPASGSSLVMVQTALGVGDRGARWWRLDRMTRKVSSASNSVPPLTLTEIVLLVDAGAEREGARRRRGVIAGAFAVPFAVA